MGIQLRSVRLAIAALLSALVLTACGSSGDAETSTSDTATDTAADAGSDTAKGSDSAAEDDVIAEVASETIVVEATTTTVVQAAPKSTTTQAQAEFILPEAGPGLGSFALQVFQAGELGLTPTEQGCIDGRRQAELGIPRGEPFDILTIAQQATAIEILLDCTGGRMEPEFVSSFDASDDLIALGFGEEFASCIFRELSRDDDEQPNVILALSSVTADQSAPEETVDAAATTFARCVDVVSFLIDSFMEDPSSALLLDPECLRTEIDEEAAADLFAASLRDPNSEDPSQLAAGFRAFRPCMRFGQLMAAQFADKATLNDAEIVCIDAAFATDEVFEATVAGEDLPASATEALVGCLEPATVTAITG